MRNVFLITMITSFVCQITGRVIQKKLDFQAKSLIGFSLFCVAQIKLKINVICMKRKSEDKGFFTLTLS